MTKPPAQQPSLAAIEAQLQANRDRLKKGPKLKK